MMTPADDRARLAEIQMTDYVDWVYTGAPADLLRMAEDGIAAREEVERLRDDLAARDLLVKALEEDAADVPQGEAEKDAEIARLRAIPPIRDLRDVAQENTRLAQLQIEQRARAEKAEAAVERVRALCAVADDSEYTTMFARAVERALDGPERPTAPATPTTDGGAA